MYLFIFYPLPITHNVTQTLLTSQQGQLMSNMLLYGHKLWKVYVHFQEFTRKGNV